MDLKLLAPKSDIRAIKVQVVASFCNLKLNTPHFEIGKDDKTEEFLRLSPLGRVPVLVTPHGHLFESNAIIKYLSNIRKEHNLLGNGTFEEAEVNMWIDFNTYELEIPICCYVLNKHCEKSLQHIKDSFNCLDKHLLYNQFMVGHNITLADICICVIINFALKSEKLEVSLLKKYRNLYRLFETVTNQKPFKFVFSESTGKKGQEKAKKNEKVAQDKKKKNVSKNDNDDDDDDEGDIYEDELKEKKPKKVNPLDLLPPSSFNLDEWKYKFSNEKDLLNVAMPHFWKVYDKNGWSLYYMKYDKLEDECTISFVASNMASGFLQRIENNFSKYSFAVVSVLGENKNFDIEGVWLFRGTEIPFEMKDHPSFEYHKFEKLDVDNADHKKKIEEYWCSKEVIDKRPVVDRKVWK